MAKVAYKNGVTSVILRMLLMDTTSVTGDGKTGLTFASAGLRVSTIADNEATPTVYTAAGSTIEDITTLGTFAAPTATKCRLKKVDDTNHPGLYEIQIADARWAVSNARSVIVTMQATGAAPVNAEIQLQTDDPYVAKPTNFNLLAIDASGRTDLGKWIGVAPLALSSQQVQALVTAMATDVLTSAALNANAVTEIQTGLATSAALATVQADTDDIQARLPAALVAGRMDASVGAMATDVLTAAALNTNAVSEIQAGLATATAVTTLQADTDDIQNRLPSALVAGRIDASVGAMATDVLTAGALAASAVTEIQTGLPTAAAVTTLQADTDDIQARLPSALVSGRMDANVGAIATDALSAAAVAAAAVAKIQSGLATASGVSAVQSDTDDLQSRLPTALVGGKMDSVISAPVTVSGSVTVGVNNDKTGYVLSSAGLDAIAITDVVSDADSRSTFPKMIRALFNRFYDRVTQTASQQKIYNDANTLTHTLPVSDDNTTQTKNKSA